MSSTAEEQEVVTPTVDVASVVRTFSRGGQEVRALRGVDLTVGPGTMVALHGRSGSGKTTLLNIIGGLDSPTSGAVRVCGTDLVRVSERERVALRRDRIAFVFQAFGLLPVLSAAENVEVPLRLHNLPTDERRAKVAHLLSLVGLGHRADHRPAELSGGEQQRVAIARALANEPDLLIADEPTGQLDSGTGQRIMDLLRSLVDEAGLAMVVATHDATLLAAADVAWELRDGQLGEGELTPRFSGDVDRTRTLSESTTLPAPPVDEHAAYRAPEDDRAAPERDPNLVHGRSDVRPRGPAARPDDTGRQRDDDRRPLRWGPDGEPLDDEVEDTDDGGS